ncbi:MAG: hypothetical protein JWP10_2027 [Nocardioidaceae bacterium]|nr:hypothetical protein [Nocardioidaceae bacterium]
MRSIAVRSLGVGSAVWAVLMVGWFLLLGANSDADVSPSAETFSPLPPTSSELVFTFGYIALILALCVVLSFVVLSRRATSRSRVIVDDARAADRFARRAGRLGRG